MNLISDRTFAVIGGDKRCAYVASDLAARRLSVKTSGLELSGILPPSLLSPLRDTLESADYLILPLPLLDREEHLYTRYTDLALDIFSIIRDCRPGARLFAGRIPGHVADFARFTGRQMDDYYDREEMQILNAVPTAEGTLGVLMDIMPRTVSGSSVLVTGYGRTAQALAMLLRACGARVTVAARRLEALAQARTAGCQAVEIERLERQALPYDAVVNTVPARVITAGVIDMLRHDCFVVDIASPPGGVDVGYAVKCGIDTRSALSLPGKVAPMTAGSIITETVLNMIREKGDA